MEETGREEHRGGADGGVNMSLVEPESSGVDLGRSLKPVFLSWHRAAQ